MKIASRTPGDTSSDSNFHYRFFLTAARSLFCAFLIVPLVALCPAPANGANLLVNPSFEANSGNAIPIGWTYFLPPTPPPTFGDYWIESAVPAHSGTLYWKQWGALYLAPPTNNVAGIYQEFSSAPSSVYQASGWFYTKSTDVLGPDCYVWLEVSFHNASGALLALYKSDNFSASIGTDTWFQYQVQNACDISVPVATGDPYYTTYAPTGTVTQLVAPAGTAKVRYRFAYLQVGKEGGSCYFDDALLEQVSGSLPPVISSVFPQNMIFVNPADGVSFNVSSPSGFTINNSGIHLTLNGTDVSGSLAFSGSTSNKTVTYQGLQSNMTYNASITVTDSLNFTASTATYFETTWVGIAPIVYLWEAEDFDFTNGMYINFPQLCATAGNPNCYFGKVGVQDVDEHNVSLGPTHLYRPDDRMGTSVSGDWLRKDHVVAGTLDYRIDPFQGNEWLNYTRDWPNGSYWIVARLASGVSGILPPLTLSRVNPDLSTTDLGTFTLQSGRGWSTYDNVYLKDTNGNMVAVTLNGKATLRVTSAGNVLPNFFALVAGQVDLPVLSDLHPNGPFGDTNALSFTVTAPGATFPAGGIKLVLHGFDVSSGLNVTGSGATRSVVYPLVQSNALHTAIITATNSLGHGIAVTNQFDTFSQNNYMVEAEDFDYGGGQFIDALSWNPGAYFGYGATTNIDYEHTFITGQQYPYRLEGIPEELARDFPRLNFVIWGGNDYHLAWFGPGDWANYTRQYPAGNFYVYGRFAGSGGYTMYLDQVVSGAGTTNQITKRLGRWSAVGRDWQIHDWVPLTDDGQSAPALVSLSGLTTLRISTTGNCNPNYFMLVPASGVPLSARLSGTNVVISFPTQAGVSYRVFYRDSLAAGNWVLLRSVLGTGSTGSVSDALTSSRRFYEVTAP